MCCRYRTANTAAVIQEESPIETQMFFIPLNDVHTSECSALVQLLLSCDRHVICFNLQGVSRSRVHAAFP